MLRSVSPRGEALRGRPATGVRRPSKQLVFERDPAFYVLIRLIMTVHLRWYEQAYDKPRRWGLAAFDFFPRVARGVSAGRQAPWRRLTPHNSRGVSSSEVPDTLLTPSIAATKFILVDGVPFAPAPPSVGKCATG